jgi:Flp pilus assembly protein TadD/predicted Ser/Thr protein kinase
MSFSPGENVGPYRIVEQLGSGGMATVYKAYHAALDRYVAIKVLHPAFKGDENFLARFQREARVVANLEHPNIVPVYDFSEHEGSPYLVMRFVEGQTLKARLNRGQLTLPEILHVIRPMGAALTYAHEQGVLHRDIKPSNVLLADDGRVFLTDFGLARIAQTGESSLTRDAMVGTPYYISPEQAMGKSELDARTDIYAFGVVLYELFTGRVPFQADTPFAVIHDHIYAPLPLPSSINPDLPPPLERVLLKALSKEPDDRYSTAAELVVAVEEAISGIAALPPARPAATPEPTPPAAGPAVEPSPERIDLASAEATGRGGGRRRWLLALGGLALLAIVVVGAILLLAGGGDEGAEPTTVERPTSVQAAVEQPPADEIAPARDFSAHVEGAVEKAVRGDIEGALEDLETAPGQRPGAVVAYLEAARQLFQRGDFEAAIIILRHGLGRNEEDIDLRLMLAEALITVDRWDEAVAELEWLIERVPDLAEPHALMSFHLAINTDDLDGALREAEVALRLNPDSPAAHFAMGVFHWRTGDLRDARLEFERAQRAPDLSPLLRQRIQFFLERMEQSNPPN